MSDAENLAIKFFSAAVKAAGRDGSVRNIAKAQQLWASLAEEAQLMYK